VTSSAWAPEASCTAPPHGTPSASPAPNAAGQPTRAESLARPDHRRTRHPKRLRDLAAGHGRPEPAITLGAAALLGPPQPAARDAFIRGLTDGYGIAAETAERVPITGNVSQAADRLAEYADAGVSHLVVGLVGEDWPAQCDLLAQARAALPGVETAPAHFAISALLRRGGPAPRTWDSGGRSVRRVPALR